MCPLKLCQNVLASDVAVEVAELVSVEVVVELNKVVRTDEFLELASLGTAVVAELVPEFDAAEVVDLLVDVAAMYVTVEVDQLVAVEVAVEHNEGGPSDKILEVVDPSTVVVAELVLEVDLLEVAEVLANRVAAGVAMEMDELIRVEVAVEHSEGGPTDTILEGVDLITFVVEPLAKVVAVNLAAEGAKSWIRLKWHLKSTRLCQLTNSGTLRTWLHL